MKTPVSNSTSTAKSKQATTRLLKALDRLIAAAKQAEQARKDLHREIER